MQEFTRQNHDDEIDLKELFYRLLSKWYYFVLLGVTGAILGFLIGNFSQPLYQACTTILLEEKSKEIGIHNMLEGNLMGGGESNIQNHIGILKSHTLNLQTLQNLNWHVSWFKKETFSNKDLYNRSPFSLDYNKDENCCNTPVKITPIDEHTYEIEVDEKIVVDGKPQSIKFTRIAKYGELFKNDYFSFLLKKQVEDVDGKYFFVFNDLERKALEFQEKLSINLLEKNAELIQVQIQGNTPARQIDYLNELCKVYLKFGLMKKNKVSLNAVKFIDRQLTGVADSLEQASILFTQFRTRNKTMDISKEAELIANRIIEIESEESVLNFRYQYYKNTLAYLQTDKDIDKIVSPSTMGIVDATINSQVVKLSELYTKKSTLTHTAEARNPKLILLNKEIKNTILILSENIKNLLANAQVEINNLKKRKKEISMRLAGLPKTEQELIDIKRKYDLNNELYTFLLKKRSEASITAASNIPDAQILDIAKIETCEKKGPNRLLNTSMGFMLGIFLAFLIIMLNDFFNDTIRSKEDLENETNLPILGEIVRNKFKSELSITENIRSRLAESFRELRTNIQYMLPSSDPKIIAVHSMVPGEGKTFNSINLAAIFAMKNMKVLIVGCDMRKTDVQNVFNTSNNSGLSTYLIDQHNFDQVTNQTHIKNLSSVPSGPIPPSPADLLENGKFECFLAEAKQRYDYIILDNAPITLVTDAFLIGKHADINIFVLRHKYSQRKQMKYINQLHEKKSVANISLVLNDVTYSRFENLHEKYGDYSTYYTDGDMKTNFFKKNFTIFSQKRTPTNSMNLWNQRKIG